MLIQCFLCLIKVIHCCVPCRTSADNRPMNSKLFGRVILHDVSMFTVKAKIYGVPYNQSKAKIYGVPYNQSCSVAFEETSSH